MHIREQVPLHAKSMVTQSDPWKMTPIDLLNRVERTSDFVRSTLPEVFPKGQKVTIS